MGKIITESGVDFGEFEVGNLFHIEASNLQKSLGQGIKTVEFIILQKKNDIIFLEAKTGCPNPENKVKDGKEATNFDKYYNEIAEKFTDSLQVYIAGILGNYENIDEIGKNLLNVKPLRSRKLKFILVITADEILEDWLQGPKLELEERLKHFMKIWKIQIVVLNKDLAGRYGLIFQASDQNSAKM